MEKERSEDAGSEARHAQTGANKTMLHELYAAILLCSVLDHS